jgi:hypothetical protein
VNEEGCKAPWGKGSKLAFYFFPILLPKANSKPSPESLGGKNLLVGGWQSQLRKGVDQEGTEN